LTAVIKPTRREFVHGSVALAGTMLASSVAAVAEPPKTKPPNIVFFLGEGQRADALSIAGHKILKTPNHDRIGADGVRFTNAFCTNALCAPARAVILTGMYSNSTGALGNKDLDQLMPADIPFFTEVLRNAGYEVAIVGKTHLRNGGEDRYWDYYFGHNAAANNYWNPFYKEGRNGTIGPQKQYKNVYADELAVERAIDWIEHRQSDKPFCLLVWFMTPHSPFYRARRYLDLYRETVIPKPATFDDDLKGYPGKPRCFVDATNKIGTTVMGDACRSLEEVAKDYYAGLTAVDDMIGSVLSSLNKKGILDDTAILQGSDHGYFLGEWRLYDKRLMHEPSIRVPLMIRYPRRIPSGTLRHEMVLDIDIAPTILDLAGVAAPHNMQGKSLLGLVNAPDPEFRKEWYYEYFEWPDPEGVRPCRGIRSEQHKYIEYMTEPQEFEMYDLQKDPGELNNLAGVPAHAALQRQLKDRMEKLRAAIPVRNAASAA
jgi:arylsulfatase A-like enzyme